MRTGIVIKTVCLLWLFMSYGTEASAIQLKVAPMSAIASGLTEPMVVYNNWSAYDELSDTIPLTEELCMTMLDEVIRLKNAGVKIDTYLMDAFWFDVDGGYRTWHKTHWPVGPDRWLKKCRDNNIIPGLWFSTNLIASGGGTMLNPVKEWESSLTSDGTVVSLFEGGYLPHLIETLQMYADMGFGLFKFDFAYFDAATDNAKATMTVDEIVNANKTAFINALKLFRAKNPNVIIIAYNGFGGEMEDTCHPFRKTVDSQWLEVFDTMYSGDPRLSDVPMMNFWRSQDLYSDQMVREFAYNGVPLSRIDNCSFMIGTTGTCYNRGTAAWKSSVILNMARGGYLNVYHGNIDLLDNDDAEWLAKAQRLFLPLQKYGKTQMLGGLPGASEPYGYRFESPKGYVYTVVNPSQAVQTIEFPKYSDKVKSRILFTDSGNSIKLNGDTLQLGAEQMAVVGVGDFADSKFDLGTEEDIVIPQDIRKVETSVYINDDHTATYQLESELHGDKLRVVFTQCDNKRKPFRTWGGGLPYGRKMSEYISIHAYCNGTELPVTINYDKVLWSGLSWGVGEFDIRNKANLPIKIKCMARDGKSSDFKVDIYDVTYCKHK